MTSLDSFKCARTLKLGTKTFLYYSLPVAEKNGVKLLAGHTRAFTLPIRAMRRVIESGKYGKLRALNIWSYSDWILRPRTADELE